MRKALLVLALVGGLGACVSSPEGAVPEWAEAEGFPSLREVPRQGTSANTDQTHWDSVEADVLAARNTAQTNPRAQAAAQPEDPSAFISDAEREIEETRNSHNPY